jgi:CspA family cold shock protein
MLQLLENVMPTGTVMWFDGQKGFGFIHSDRDGRDIFVHISAVQQAGLRSLNEGQKVEYQEKQDRRSGRVSVAQFWAIYTPRSHLPDVSTKALRTRFIT